MTKEQRELLANMKNNQFGEALRLHLAELMEEVGDVSKCDSWEDTLGRKHAKNFLIEAFKFLEKPETPKATKNDYT